MHGALTLDRTGYGDVLVENLLQQDLCTIPQVRRLWGVERPRCWVSRHPAQPSPPHPVVPALTQHLHNHLHGVLPHAAAGDAAVASRIGELHGPDGHSPVGPPQGSPLALPQRAAVFGPAQAGDGVPVGHARQLQPLSHQRPQHLGATLDSWRDWDREIKEKSGMEGWHRAVFTTHSSPWCCRSMPRAMGSAGRTLDSQAVAHRGVPHGVGGRAGVEAAVCLLGLGQPERPRWEDGVPWGAEGTEKPAGRSSRAALFIWLHPEQELGADSSPRGSHGKVPMATGSPAELRTGEKNKLCSAPVQGCSVNHQCGRQGHHGRCRGSPWSSAPAAGAGRALAPSTICAVQT